MRVLITGATGFTGGHLTRWLAARGDRVRVLVRARPESDRGRSVIHSAADPTQIEVVSGPEGVPDALDRLLAI